METTLKIQPKRINENKVNGVHLYKDDYTHNVIKTPIQRRPNVTDVVWTLRKRRVRTGREGRKK